VFSFSLSGKPAQCPWLQANILLQMAFCHYAAAQRFGGLLQSFWKNGPWPLESLRPGKKSHLFLLKI
jgi:hypothetical protein